MQIKALRRPEPREPLSRADFELAQNLVAKGMSISDAARTIGRKPESFRSALKRHERGNMKFVSEVDEARYQKYLKMALDGTSLGQIAREHNCSTVNVYQILARRGWDSETLAEARNAPISEVAC